jgi:ATP-dependent DNA ligase
VKAAELLGFGFALVVGWTDPEGRRPYLGALLLAYYDPDGRLVYAGRAGTGINTAELERLWRRLQPLATNKMPLDVPPPRTGEDGVTAFTKPGIEYLQQIIADERAARRAPPQVKPTE